MQQLKLIRAWAWGCRAGAAGEQALSANVPNGLLASSSHCPHKQVLPVTLFCHQAEPLSPSAGAAGRAALSQQAPACPTPDSSQCAQAAPFHFSRAYAISKGKTGSFESKAFCSTCVSTDKESFMEVTIAVHYHKHGFLLKFTCYA